jgi:hypothetical protein
MTTEVIIHVIVWHIIVHHPTHGVQAPVVKSLVEQIANVVARSGGGGAFGEACALRSRR